MMKSKKIIVAGIIVLILTVSLLSRVLIPEETGVNQARNPSSNYPQRIISLAPSITETLYALGLGDKIVGVTRYCIYPPEANEKPKLGGYYDPSLESIISLEPDLVILLAEHKRVKETMENLGVKTLQIEHRYIDEIINSIEVIGKVCGAEENAGELIDDTRTRLEKIRAVTRNKAPKKVMITVGRNMGSGSLTDIYIVGRNNYYDELINLAGGTNAYQGNISFPAVSAEGMLQMDPDIIIDLVYDLYEKNWDEEKIKKEWDVIPNLRAVRENGIHVLGGNHVVVPGPRFILMAEEITAAINPDFKVKK